MRWPAALDSRVRSHEGHGNVPPREMVATVFHRQNSAYGRLLPVFVVSVFFFRVPREAA